MAQDSESVAMNDRRLFILIDGLEQKCSIPSALAMEILQSCNKPSIRWAIWAALIQKWQLFLVQSARISHMCVIIATTLNTRNVAKY